MENPFDLINAKLDRIEALVDEKFGIKAEPKKQGALMTRKETMEFLNVKTTTLWRLTRDGVIKSYKVGSRVMYKRSEVLAALETMKT